MRSFGRSSVRRTSCLQPWLFLLWLHGSKNENKNYQMFVFPMIFMFLATLSALLIVMKNNLAGGNFIMVAMAGILFVLALILVKEGADVLIKNRVDKVNKKLG